MPWAEGRVLTRGWVDGLPAFTWGRADRDQLATARQLRELGLRPGGAEPVAVLVFGHTQPYRRQVEHAGLYRIADAVPKRTTTPAQRAAIAKALAAQRSCQRCGEEQDYYVSTTSRQCGPCEDATGFRDHDQPDVDAVGGSCPPAVADVVAAEGNDGAARAVSDTRAAAGRSGSAGASSVVQAPPVQRHDALAERAGAVDPVAGDGSARSARLVELYDKYWPSTVRFIAARVRRADRDLAEDLAQHTFLRAWPYLDRAPIHADDRMRPWLATIARHVVAEQYRKGPARQRAAETSVAPDALLWGSARVAAAERVSAELAAVELRTDLAAAMAQLPPLTRQVLRLRILDDLPAHEVARRLGRGRATVIRHTAIGLGALREHLTGDRGPTRAAQRRGQPRCPLGMSLSDYVRCLDEASRNPRRQADPAIAAMPLRDYGQTRWVPAMRGLAEGTAAPYLSGWRQRVLPTLGDLPVRSIDPAAIHRAVQSWTTDGAGPSVLKNTRAVLIRVLDQAVREGVLQHNPATSSAPPPSTATAIDTATSTEPDPATRHTTADLAEADDLVDDAPLTERGTADLREWDQINRPEQLAELSRPEQQAAAVTAEQDPPAPDPASTAQPSKVRQPATPARGPIGVLTRPEPGLPAQHSRSSRSADAPTLAVADEPVPTIDAADPAAADGQPATNGQAADDNAAEDAVSWAGRQQQPSIAETAAAVTRAREALARIAQARAAQTQATADQSRGEQLARWHADDHATDRANQAAGQAGGRHRELEGITR